MMTMWVKDIREKLPIKTTPSIIGEPTYTAINEVQEALYKNVAATPKTLGGRHNGHIGIIMGTAVYDNVSTTAYTRPMELGPYTQHGLGESEAPQANVNAIQKEGIRIYDLDDNV